MELTDKEKAAVLTDWFNSVLRYDDFNIIISKLNISTNNILYHLISNGIVEVEEDLTLLLNSINMLNTLNQKILEFEEIKKYDKKIK